MPATKRRQSNAMLYTLITFIGLFVIATTAAVIYYVKAEEFRSDRDDLQQKADSLATAEEYRSLGTIVGDKMRGQSYLGTMAEYLNRMLVLVKGGPVPMTSAEVKVANSVKTVQDLVRQAAAYVALPVIEPNKPADANAVLAADPNAPRSGGIDPNRIALTGVPAGRDDEDHRSEECPPAAVGGPEEPVRRRRRGHGEHEERTDGPGRRLPPGSG
jgi:hypothetical protein